MQTIGSYIILEAAAFIAAALAHFGLLIGGYEHLKAGTAESCITASLLNYKYLMDINRTSWK